MAYNKQTWKDEIPDLTKPIKDASGKQKTDPQTGRPIYELVQEGTRITSARLNHIEDGVEGAHTQLAELSEDVETHSSDKVKHLTAAERTAWNSKETLTGAQQKADASLASANSYTDTKLLTKADKSSTYSKTETDQRIKAVIGAAPEALDTLKEIGDALNNDPDFAGTMTTQLAGKVDKVSGKQLSTENFSSEEKAKLAGLTTGAGGAGSATDTVIGDRTITDTQAPTGNTGSPTKLWGWLAWMIRAITGKGEWYTPPATTLEAAKEHADDTARHLTAAERTAWNNKETTAGAQSKADAAEAAAKAGSIALSQRNVPNGVAALDNASLIVGQGLRLGGSEQYVEKVFSFQTANGTANQKIDYTFGPAVMTGFIEVTVTGSWGNAPSEGRLTKRMDVMGNTAGIINRQSSQYTEVSGAIRGQLSISDVYWKDGKWTVTVEARTNAGNSYTTHVKHHGPIGAKDWVQSSVYTGAATTLPVAVQVIPDDTRTKSGQQIETTDGSQSKADAAQAAAIAYTDTKVGRVDLTQTLGPGTSVVVADGNGSELDLTVQGRTLVNLLGSYGDGESLTGWTQSSGEPVILSSTQKRSGSSSFKGVPNASKGSYVYRDFNTPLDTAKQYVLAFAVFVETYTNGNQEVSLRDIGTFTPKYNVYLGASVPVGSWQTYYLKIPAGNTMVGNGFRLLVGAGGAMVNYMYFDDLRLYEVSSAEYAAIGTTISGAAIDSYFPHVSGKQHVQGVAVTKQGKNAASVTVLSMTNTVNGATFNEDRSTNSITVNSGTVAGYNYAATSRIQVIPNTVYTLSAILTNVSGPDLPSLSVRKGSDNGVSNITGLGGTGPKSFSFNSGTETEIILFAYGSVATAAVQTKRYENIQLELGSTATPYTPAEPQSVILPVTLGQIGDVRDSVFSQGVDWMYMERIKRDIALDGSLPWNFTNTYTGYKRLNALISAPAARIGGIFQRAIKYTGGPLTHLALAPTAADQFLVYDNNNVYLSVAGTDSGWTDAVNPSNNAIKGLMNGWKATANDGSAYTLWVSILDGSAPATNTSTYVAANKAPGWTSWATLDYVLAQAAAPIPVPNAEGSISLHPGGNQISVETGIVQRERVTVTGGEPKYINAGTKMSYPAARILQVYKGADIDNKWLLGLRGARLDPFGVAFASISAADYDANATYYVTYIALDKYPLTANVTETAASWRTGLGGVVSELVQSTAELRQDNDRQDFADDYIEAKVDNLRLGIADTSALPDTIQKHRLTQNAGALFQLVSGSVDSLTTTRMYTIATGAVTGLPVASTGILEVVGIMQRFTEVPSLRTWKRRINAGVWNAWVEDENASRKNSAGGYAGLTTGAVLPDSVIPQSVSRRVQLWSQLQKNSYRRSVIALCELTNTNINFSSYSNGVLSMKRGNGLSGQVTALVSAEKRYNTTTMNYSAFRIGATVQVFRPCTFTFNGVKYGGVDLYISDAEFSFVEFNGASNFGIFAVDYYDTQTSTALNSEIFDSMNTTTDHTFITDINFNGSGLNAERVAGKTLADVVQGSLSYLGTLADSSPNFTGTANPPIAVLAAGQRLSFKALSSTSGPITLNVNGLGAKSIKKPNGNNPPLVQGGVYTVIYDGQAFILQGEGGEYGTAEAAQVLTGYTVGRESGVVNGAMPNRSAENNNIPPLATAYWKPGDGGQPEAMIHLRPPDGYYNGSTWVSVVVPDLLARNLPADKNVLGMQGAIPRRGAYTDSSSSGWDGNYMYVRIPQGVYQDNSGLGTPEIRVSAAQARADGNIIPSNIRAGVWVYGEVGTLIEGKRSYSGSGVTSGYNSCVRADGSSVSRAEVYQYYPSTGWTPSKVVVTWGTTGMTIFIRNAGGQDMIMRNDGGTSVASYSGGYSVNSGGFLLSLEAPGGSSIAYNFTAYE